LGDEAMTALELCGLAAAVVPVDGKHIGSAGERAGVELPGVRSRAGCLRGVGQDVVAADQLHVGSVSGGELEATIDVGDQQRVFEKGTSGLAVLVGLVDPGGRHAVDTGEQGAPRLPRP